MRRVGQEFFWDSDNNKFYYVNYQEMGYMEITEENKELHHFMRNIFCHRWVHREKEVDTFKLVKNIEDIYKETE